MAGCFGGGEKTAVDAADDHHYQEQSPETFTEGAKNFSN